MIAQLSPRQRAARRQWADPLARARLLAGQLIAADERRRAQLVESHLHLLDFAAAHWARRYPSLDRDDLRQAAYFGLRRAAERFDPERGVLFSTFAFHGLRDAIQRELPSLLGIVRVPKRHAFPRRARASPRSTTTRRSPRTKASRARSPLPSAASFGSASAPRSTSSPHAGTRRSSRGTSGSTGRRSPSARSPRRWGALRNESDSSNRALSQDCAACWPSRPPRNPSALDRPSPPEPAICEDRLADRCG